MRVVKRRVAIGGRVSEGIRTPDNRNHNPTPHELNSTGDDNLRQPDASACRKSPPFDPVLQAVIDAWPTLPEAMRRAVLALVDAAGYS